MPPPQNHKRSSAEIKRLQSAQMVDAQNHFRRVVKAELNALLLKGIEKDIAIKTLLHRIVEYSDEPSQSDVTHVMHQFRMNREDATRALIVKQELGRLKIRGLNPLAAIEELTNKMQGMSPVSPLSSNVKKIGCLEMESTFPEMTSEINSVGSEIVSEGSKIKSSIILNASDSCTSNSKIIKDSVVVSSSYMMKEVPVTLGSLSSNPHTTLKRVSSEVLLTSRKRPHSTEESSNEDVWGNCFKKVRASTSMREREELPKNIKRSRAEMDNLSLYPDKIKRMK